MYFNYIVMIFLQIKILKHIKTKSNQLASMDDLSNVPLNVIVFYSSIVLFMILIIIASVYRLCRSHNENEYSGTRRPQLPLFSSIRATTDNTNNESNIFS